MPKHLIIVESPAKAKTIEKYVGNAYQVASSNGHVRDLIKGNHAINVEAGFLPTYEVTPGKERLVQQLKQLAQKSDWIYLASDDDREGESISWHLKEALALHEAKIKRIVFREVTEKAVRQALEQPRSIDLDLVHAQQARRILDRLVGYDLSPLLWKKIKTGLSAGRVQSVAVRMVVERERAIDHFVPTSNFVVNTYFLLETGQRLKAECSVRFTQEADVVACLQKCHDAIFTIQKLDKKLLKRSPSPPFTTSTLQQEASRRLGFSVTRTMALAQQLYETGHISYMRTDAVHLSEEMISAIAQEIETSYGGSYSCPRRYRVKSSTAQEAHEAIRPTCFSVKAAGNNRDEQRLYELIWRRTVACQMADAQIEKTVATIQMDNASHIFLATGEVLKFPGFLKVYMQTQDEDDEKPGQETENMLPPLQVQQPLNLDEVFSRERFTRPPFRYTEASLVRDLEEREIGRPSTYAPTISVIQKRGYVELASRPGVQRSYKFFMLKEGEVVTTTKTEVVHEEKKKLFPTDVAVVTNDFLVKYFADVTDYNFTANVEKQLDKVAKGVKIWDQMLLDFYTKFHPKVQETAAIDRSLVNYHRCLGKDPKTGGSVIVRLGKYGPLVQLGLEEDDVELTPKFAGLRPMQRMETITLEEALDLFSLPRTLGTYEETSLLVNVGRFGPYVKHGDKFYAIGKGDDPFKISLEEAIAIIEAKRKADKEKLIKSFAEDSDVQVLNGRWGAYIKQGKKNVRVPKDVQDPKALTLEACLSLLKKQDKK